MRSVPVGAYYPTQSTLAKAEFEIATNIVDARWLGACSNDEHEMIGKDAGRLPAREVEAIARVLLGDAGIVGVTMLRGWFTGVSLTLSVLP